MTLSKTGVLTGIIFFYSFLSILIGLFATSTNVYIDGEQEIKTGVLGFLGSIVTGYSQLPVAINVLIFGSLGLILAWIGLSSLPTVDGGS